MANTAWGRPAPRTTVVGTRLVSTTVVSNRNAGTT